MIIEHPGTLKTTPIEAILNELTSYLEVFVVSWEYGDSHGKKWKMKELYLSNSFEGVLEKANYGCPTYCIESSGKEDLTWWNIVKIQKLLFDGPIWIGDVGFEGVSDERSWLADFLSHLTGEGDWDERST